LTLAIFRFPLTCSGIRCVFQISTYY